MPYTIPYNNKRTCKTKTHMDGLVVEHIDHSLLIMVLEKSQEIYKCFISIHTLFLKKIWGSKHLFP
jgi:hypothetical protein